MIRCYWCRHTLAEFVECRAIIRCPNDRCNRLNVIEGRYDVKVAAPNPKREEEVVNLTRVG